MLAYRYNAPSALSRRIAIVDQSPPPPISETADRYVYDWAAAEERARKGFVPAPPKSSSRSFQKQCAPTLAKIVAIASKGDIAALKKMEIKSYNSRLRAVIRYRDICVEALKRSKIA